MHAELGEHVLDVGAQGACRDIHFTRHLPGTLARHNSAQHLLFPRGEVTLRVARGPLGPYGTRLYRAEDLSAGRDHIQRFGDVIDTPVFSQEPSHADPRGLRHDRTVGDAGKHEYRGFRETLAYYPSGVKAIRRTRETEVEQAGVRPVLFDLGNSQRSG